MNIQNYINGNFHNPSQDNWLDNNRLSIKTNNTKSLKMSPRAQSRG